MLNELITCVIGVDTHRDTHTFAVVASNTGGVLEVQTLQADASGYEAAITFADLHCDGEQRVWAIEGTGSYGAGLCAALQARGEWVVEVERPHRSKPRNGRKTDEIDAVRAARDALSSKHPGSPRKRGDREALRVAMAVRESAMSMKIKSVNQLKALIVGSPERLRAQLRQFRTPVALLSKCAKLRSKADDSAEYSVTVNAIHQLAKRIRSFDAEIKACDKTIDELTRQLCPELLDEVGVGPFSAALIYLSWSHAGRFHSESAYAMSAGVAPLEASSGAMTRHRLNRGGDRRTNRALHTVALSRAKVDPRTKLFIEKHAERGMSKRETYRLLARYLARHFYRVLETSHPQPMTP